MQHGFGEEDKSIVDVSEEEGNETRLKKIQDGEDDIHLTQKIKS
jgi:hypothetical protein